NDNEAKTSPVNVEMNAAKLLCRMLLRRKQWIEIESIHYQEVDPCIMEDCLHVLHVHNIVQLSKHDLVLTDEMNESLLQCLTKSRLKSVIQTCSLNNMSLTKFNALNRSDMTQCIVQQLNKQTTLFGTKIMHSKQFIQLILKKKNNRVLFINLNHNNNNNNNNNDKEISGDNVFMELMDKCNFLFYLNHHQSMYSSVLSQLGKVHYPHYRLSDHCRSLFPSKDIFDAYQQERALLINQALSYVEIAQQSYFFKKKYFDQILQKEIKKCLLNFNDMSKLSHF
ncbi:hypothetical protein RFI_04174, partial [Reticulomyxa filosa]